jgi:TolA-binding protein
MNTNLFRKSIAGLVLAGGLLAGTAGIAAAETGSTGTTQKPTQEQVCRRASQVWDRLQALDEKLHQHYRKIVALRDKAEAEGKTELAEQLTQRLERVKDRHERIETKLKELRDKAADKCNLPAPELAPLES